MILFLLMIIKLPNHLNYQLPIFIHLFKAFLSLNEENIQLFYSYSILVHK